MRSNSCSSADSGGSCGRPERQASRSSRSLIPSRKVLKFFTSKEPHQLTDAVPAEVRRAPVDFAGILLEYTSVEDLSSMLGMTREEIERVMGVSAAWPFPAHKDVWKMAHDAIRFDLDNLLAAILRSKQQVDSGKPLYAWQCQALHAVARNLVHNVRQHHEHEERVVLPWLAARVRHVPAAVAGEHRRAILAALERVREVCRMHLHHEMQLVAMKALVADLHVTVTNLRALARRHLEAEELVGLALMRTHATASEAREPQRRILADLPTSHMAWLLRPLARESRQAILDYYRVSQLVQRLVIMPAVRKDEKRIVRAYKELAAGPGGLPPPPRSSRRPVAGLVPGL